MEGRLADAAWELEREEERRSPWLAAERRKAANADKPKAVIPFWAAPHEPINQA